MSIFLILAIVLLLNGAVMTGLEFLCRSAYMEKHRERKDFPRRVPAARHARSRIINSVVSTGLLFGLCFVLHDQLFTHHSHGAGTVVLQVAGMLALYDLSYYVLHRFIFHSFGPGKKIHGVHHRILSPFVQDSLYIHPAETVLGLLLFIFCAWMVGPLSVYAFGIGFFIYSAWNLFIHSAFHLPFFPFKFVSSLVSHHDLHHRSMKSGNYASLTPMYDILFGTATDRKTQGAKPLPKGT